MCVRWNAHKSAKSTQKRKKRTKAQKAHKYSGTRLNILGCTVKPLFFRPKRKKRTKAQKAHKSAKSAQTTNFEWSYKKIKYLNLNSKYSKECNIVLILKDTIDLHLPSCCS